MTCFTPCKAHYHEGKLVFGDSTDGNVMFVPCGRCNGCRTDLTKDWAVRCYHESMFHTESCVLTLTFDDKYINSNFSLNKPDIQKFLKRLRKSINKKISYLYCGEYGSKFERPHYHIIIFGHDFNDKIYLKDSPSGDKMYVSPSLNKTWGFGHATIGSFSMSSAFYCASYITKFVPVLQRSEFYGERVPEFGHASKKPALGVRYLEKYLRDLFINDCVVIEGQKYRIPRYYLKWTEKYYPKIYEQFKLRREESIDGVTPDWYDLSNKYQISIGKLKSRGKILSRDNHLRSEYIRKNKEFL